MPVCDAGTDGTYQHVLYAYKGRNNNRLAAVAADIRTAMARMNGLLNAESLASGGPTADYDVKCLNAVVRIDALEVKGTDYNGVVSAARKKGFNAPRVDYTIFLDVTNRSYCGVGSFYSSETAGTSNPNYTQGGYAISYQGCWFDRTPMHENGHNQGAVQYGAPNSTGTGAHCNQDRDVMCYTPDGGDLLQGPMIDACPALAFDCGKDTYFDSAPETGEYLASNWNVGASYNGFITFGRGS